MIVKQVVIAVMKGQATQLFIIESITLLFSVFTLDIWFPFAVIGALKLQWAPIAQTYGRTRATIQLWC